MTKSDLETSLGARGEPAAVGAGRIWCLFRAGGRPFAVALEAVAEVIEVDRLVPLPQSPPGVLGLCALRREVVPVVEPAGPGAAGDGRPGPCLVLILRTAQGVWGLRAAPGSVAVAEGRLDDDGRREADGATPGLLGTVRRDAVPHAAIDHEATWRGVRGGVGAWPATHP